MGEIKNEQKINLKKEEPILILSILDIFEESKNIELNVTNAEKYENNPVIPLGKLREWDSLGAAVRAVFYDEKEKIFKCWYIGRNFYDKTTVTYRKGNLYRRWQVGYTVSKDGIIWHKPKLGLYEYNGSKDNNIVIPYITQKGKIVNEEVEATIFKDDLEKDENRR